MIVALAGGVGGARLARGLAALLPPERLTIIVNTGDDFEHLGFSISPDLDTVMYTLAGIANPQTGWGRADETWNFMESLGQLGGETWFKLGDRDLAVHVMRTAALGSGKCLSDVTQALSRKLGIDHAIVPMSDEPVRTFVLTRDGELPFQEYFVARRCKPPVRGFRFAGSESARAPRTLRAVFEDGKVEAAILCPSNPYISIAPLFSVRDIRQWLETRTFPVVGISPIIGGEAVKGPAAKMMRELGLEPTALAIARHYGPIVDGWVIDEEDANLAPEIEALGKQVVFTDTLMTDPPCSESLALKVLDLASQLARGHS